VQIAAPSAHLAEAETRVTTRQLLAAALRELQRLKNRKGYLFDSNEAIHPP